MIDRSIQKALEQDAQIISERIPTVMEQKEAQVIIDFKDFLEARKISQTKAAKMMDVSSTQLSQVLAKKYEGRLGDILNKMVHLMNSITRRERNVRNKPYVETSVAKKIEAVIKHTDGFSREEGKIGLIIGDSGHGKTRCLEAYAAVNKSVIYVELHRGMKTTMIFAEIAKRIGGIITYGFLSTITQGIITKLSNMRSIIVIDEASFLNVYQLDLLRQIISVKSRCPMILAGNSDLLKTVLSPTTKRGCESLDQFSSRLMQILNLDEDASSGDGGLYTADDIRKLYDGSGIKLTTDGIKTLRAICKTPHTGRLRICSVVIDALFISRPYMESQKKQRELEVDAELILSAIKQLRLPVKERLPVAVFDRDETETERQAVAKAG